MPPSGATVHLTAFAGGAMAVLAVFALALLFATGRVADRWADGLAREATVRIAADADPAALERLREVAAQTPGIATVHVVTAEEAAALLAPWLGPDLPVAALPMPQLVTLSTEPGFDAAGFRLRLEGELPEAVLDDHGAWRAPLVAAAGRLRALGWGTLALITGALAAVVTLAAAATLASNAQAIAVLRLVGAEDAFIARAFVRQITLRTAVGAALGTALGMLAVSAMPATASTAFLTGLRFERAEWLAPLLIPPLAVAVAWAATRHASFRRLKETR